MNDFTTDPCPACKPNTVCRTPSCGRLKGKRQEPVIENKQAEPVAWVDPVALGSVNKHYDRGFIDAIAECKRLNHPAVAQEPVARYADPFTCVIQCLNMNPYSMTKDECVQYIKKLREKYYKDLPAPAVAVNEQLLDCLEIAFHGLSWYHENYPESVEECDHEALQQIEAAIAAADAQIKGQL